MTPLRRPWLLLAALAASWAVLPLLAQRPELGAFAGVVRDEQGQPLAGATVVFRGLDFNLRRETRTERDGRFYYGGFQSGRYQIAVLRAGRVLWLMSVTLPQFQPVVELDINLQKLREAAERVPQLDPELERQREAERQRREQEDQLQGHLSRGARQLAEGHPERALEEYQAAVALDPNRGLTHALLGAAYAAANRREEAIAAYQRALQLEPTEGAHHNNLAALLARNGQLDEALPHFAQAVRLDPERAATYHFNTGAALFNANRLDDALPAFRQATRSDLKFAPAHYFLGLVLFRTSPRRPSEHGPERVEPRPGTIEAFQRYLQLAPDGEYADSARDYLNRLGAGPPQMLSPTGPRPEEFE